MISIHLLLMRAFMCVHSIYARHVFLIFEWRLRLDGKNGERSTEPSRENNNFGFPTRSDTNLPLQSQKQARSLKFRVYVEEQMYYPCSENKGADQLCSHCTADLRLCFRVCSLLVFWCGSSTEDYLLQLSGSFI